MKDEWVATAASILEDQGGLPHDRLHSWRCGDKGRYPQGCTCVADVVTDIIDAIEPLIRADERARVLDELRVAVEELAPVSILIDGASPMPVQLPDTCRTSTVHDIINARLEVLTFTDGGK